MKNVLVILGWAGWKGGTSYPIHGPGKRHHQAKRGIKVEGLNQISNPTQKIDVF
jgi:hypothetical protein